MRKIELKLVNPIKVIPVKGNSYVTVETDGVVEIQDPAPAPEPRTPRYRTLADTGAAQLKLSAHGLYRKVEIRLLAHKSSRSDFMREMNTLFDEELIQKYL